MAFNKKYYDDDDDDDDIPYKRIKEKKSIATGIGIFAILGSIATIIGFFQI